MYEELSKNVRRSWLLMAGFIAVVAGAAYGFGFLFGDARIGSVAVAVAAVVSIAMAWGSYAAGDRIVLRASRARRVTREDEPRYHNLVEGLCLAGGIPMPALYVIEDPAPNAFATGRDPEHASIAVTRGLLDRMNRVELEGVLAHELAHVKNRDTLVMAVAATLVGIVVLLADIAFRAVWWGGARRRGRDGGAGALLLPLAFVLALLMPLVARAMHLAISRRREFFADVAGVHMTRYPPGLISALKKLRDDTTVVRSATRATAHLWIESPLQRADSRTAWLNRLFDTHPPLDDRIRVLEEL